MAGGTAGRPGLGIIDGWEVVAVRVIERAVLATPIGGIGVEVFDGAVCRVSFAAAATSPLAPTGSTLTQAYEQLDEYFRGERTEFSLPLGAARGNDFEAAVWSAIAEIPYGRTRSYGEIARAVGDPGAAQAVGQACNRNPLPIVVACHRVIGADGKLVGFGGGLRRKRWLLALEARVEIERTFVQGL